jgi:SAM-dependent methyltransferase
VEQRFSFDGVADLYDAARPDYPAALFDDLTAAAGLRAGDPLLEVGCGTGKATQSFMRGGVRVTALDPGAAMIEAARRRTSGLGAVEFIQSTFEAWDAPVAAFRLIAAAQAWHWVAPEVGLAKAAGALRAEGALAIFGNVPIGVPTGLLEAFKGVYAAQAPSLLGPVKEGWYLPDGPVRSLIAVSNLFEPARHIAYAWSHSHTAESFTGLLTTLSDVRMLAPARRDGLLRGVAAAVEDYGGAFDLAYETHLYLAKRL